MRVILLAPPGAGKGTQGGRISARYDVPHISSGDLFRREVARDSPTGRQVRDYLTAGDLAPDDLVVELLAGPIVDAAKANGGYVLDGFPRTVAQAEAAAEIARDEGLAAQAVLHLDAPDEVLLERLLARAQGRADDSARTVQHRLDVYAESTRPLLDYYDSRGLLVTIDATPPVDDVSATIFTRLDPLRASPTAHPPGQ